MATFVRLPSGSWRAVIRRKSRYASQTFALRDDARAWALEAERRVDRDEPPKDPKTAALDTFGGLVDQYVADLKKSGKALALQLQSIFDVSPSSGSLMGSSP